MAKDLSFQEVKGNILQRKFMPVYLFQGEESYYIDVLTNLLIDNVLTETERDFNQTILYGPETDVGSVINSCKRFPMMSEHQLIVVKEAQGLKNIDDLVHYVHKPLMSTVLVLNYKYGKMDGRKKLPVEIAKAGILFESKKLYDNQIPTFITSYLQDRKLGVDPKAAQLLADFLGADLSKIANEIEKLRIALPSGQMRITADDIERNIGISKDFNNFELIKAIAKKDVLKANRIALYFEANPKNNPMVMTMNALYNYFSNLMICTFEKDKSQQNVMTVLGLRFGFQAEDYMDGLRNYNAFKTMDTIALIREFDAKSKGFGSTSSSTHGDLLKELLFKIMH